MIKKYFTFIITFIFSFHILSGITLEQKINLTNRIKEINGLINKREFSKAKYFAINIKKEYPDTEFVSLANYYLARIETINKNDYKALYYLNMALKDKHFFILTKEWQYKIIFYTAKINYKLDIFDTAKTLFYRCTNQDYFQKDSVYLYLADIYIMQDRNQDKGKFFLGKIDWNNLNFKEKELYSRLTNVTMWKKIDTTLIGYRDPNVSCTLIDSDVIYIGLWQGGLIRYNYILDNYKFYGVSYVVSENVRALYKDKRFIYIGTTKGANIIDKRTGTISQIDALYDKSISSITGNENNIFFGTLNSSIVVFNKKENKFATLGNFRNISKLYFTDNTLIITTYPYGIYFYKNGKISKLQAFGVPRYPVTDVKKYNDTFWFATYGGGVYKYNKKENIFYRYSSLTGEVDEDYCLSINTNKGKIYVGTLGGGIYYYSTITKSWNKFNISDMYFGTDVKTIDFTTDYMFIGTLGDGVLQFNLIKK